MSNLIREPYLVLHQEHSEFKDVYGGAGRQWSWNV